MIISLAQLSPPSSSEAWQSSSVKAYLSSLHQTTDILPFPYQTRQTVNLSRPAKCPTTRPNDSVQENRRLRWWSKC